MAECNCPHTAKIAQLEARSDNVARDFAKIDAKLDQVLMSLSRVEVLETKHNTHNEALTRAFQRVEKLEQQVDDTARTLADLLSQIKGMTRLAIVLWTVMGASVGYLLNRLA